MVEYKCPKCGKLFNKKSNYTNHVYHRKTLCGANVIPTDGTNPKVLRNTVSKHICMECNKTYSSRSNLNKHVRNIHGSKSNEHNGISKIELSLEEKMIESDDETQYNDINSITSNNDNVKNAPKCSKDLVNAPNCSNNTKNKLYQCQYCFSNFTRSNNLNRHIQNRCKVKKQQDQEKELNNSRLIQEMQEKIKQLEQQINNNGDINSHNTVNSNNTDNSTTNNINLVAFGKEDLSYISDEVTKQILSHGCMAVPWLIKEAHYNNEQPNHQNVLLSNLRSNHVKIFNGTSWIAQDKKEILERLYNIKNAHLQKKYKKFKEEIDNYAEIKFQRFINTCEEEEVKRNVTKRIEQMMYNKRSLPAVQKEKMERKVIK